MPDPTEEERRRKIIIDAEVARVAAKGIGAVVSGELNQEQTRALIKCDEDYLAMVNEIVPHFTEKVSTE